MGKVQGRSIAFAAAGPFGLSHLPTSVVYTMEIRPSFASAKSSKIVKSSEHDGYEVKSGRKAKAELRSCGEDPFAS